jgi:aminocarboxymuconate-semialdehyde decarboxylase
MAKTTQKGSKVKSIDVHAHIIPSKEIEVEEKYRTIWYKLSQDSFGRDVLSVKGLKPDTIRKELFDVELRLKEMDDTKVDIQAISIMPTLIQYDIDPDLSIGYSRILNDALADIVKAYPDRFVGLATAPLQAPKEAAKELERSMKELGMRGAQILPDVNGLNLDWPELWPFYEKAQELGAFILIHPINAPGTERIPKYHLRNLIGNPIATTIAAASLIFGGVLKDFPKLKFCFSHAGGFAPYQRGRFEHGYKVRLECKEFIPKPPSEYFKLLYFDTIAHYLPALEYLAKTAGIDNVLLGSDYPFDMADPDPVGSVNAMKIPATGKRKILGETAARLLGIA